MTEFECKPYKNQQILKNVRDLRIEVNVIAELVKRHDVILGSILSQLQIKEKPQEDDDNLPKFISDLELSVRSRNCLNNAGIITIKDLQVQSYADLIRIANLGKKSILEIKEALESHGINHNIRLYRY